MKMKLSVGVYTYPEMVEIFETRDNQGIKRKLERYGIEYNCVGRGANVEYTIRKINDPFKVFCITELGFSAQTVFLKLRNFLYYALNDDDFLSMPDEVKEYRLKEKADTVGATASRQTIANWEQKFEKMELFHVDTGNFIYYFAYHHQQTYTTRQRYNSAWKEYWEQQKSGVEYEDRIWYMITNYGGIARKQEVIEINGIYKDTIDTLVNLVNDSIDSQIENVDFKSDI